MQSKKHNPWHTVNLQNGQESPLQYSRILDPGMVILSKFSSGSGFLAVALYLSPLASGLLPLQRYLVSQADTAHPFPLRLSSPWPYFLPLQFRKIYFKEKNATSLGITRRPQASSNEVPPGGDAHVCLASLCYLYFPGNQYCQIAGSADFTMRSLVQKNFLFSRSV